ncbi:NAD(P)/FAD-dependent oxidoreductase [Thalassomonas viridans]|uniref:NAD(P)/FAD-dependent oxidoreductase n=1 Tax=Thalassomonas viridans TaxID=137584 RepID=A0AAE9Z9B7_9GAMM|nr:NAD(P)/FAD-dependent oxidoreductase [Thalassomonas viridans]WDE09096.1 NAD(P)/FAD-dependent oxidoreductase [Thalassomonas viridans]
MINNQSIAQEYDVVIVGAGWAGLALARQLKRENADLRIIQLEASTEFKAKIGEATVEITGHYFLKKLGLANYLYRHQLPKNALRFFFDTPEHSLPIEQMSEQGTVYIPPHPAFQLERATFEAALMEMNREDGITILQGARMTGFELDHQDGHTVNFKYQDQVHQVRGKWLVDASGRAGVITKKMKSHNRENVPMHSSAWGRFRGVKDFDSAGTRAWQDKASSRFLSTNHFTGHGYWIWFIPLKSGLTSIGIVCDKTKVESPPLKEADFIAKLKEHTAIADLIEDAEMEDFEAWGQLAYRGNGVVNRERWGATGFSAMFLDPLLSGGGDVIAMSNDNLSKLILADFANPDKEAAQTALDEGVPYANAMLNYYYQFLYAQLMNLYPVLDCARLCSPVMAYINATYFITNAWDYLEGNFTDYPHFDKNAYIRRGSYALEMMMQRQILDTLEVLRSEDRAFDRNDEGFFETGADLYKYYIYQMGQKGKDGYRIDFRVKLFTLCFAQVTGTKLNLPKFGNRRMVQNALNLPMILKNPTFGREQLPALLSAMSENLTRELQQTTEHTVLVEVSETSFHDEKVSLTVVGDTADSAQLKQLQRTANSIWMHQQEYIDQASFVPEFLRFARQQPEDLMDPCYPVRLESSEMLTQ